MKRFKGYRINKKFYSEKSTEYNYKVFQGVFGLLNVNEFDELMKTKKANDLLELLSSIFPSQKIPILKGKSSKINLKAMFINVCLN